MYIDGARSEVPISLYLPHRSSIIADDLHTKLALTTTPTRAVNCIL